jgi:radical SAM superfamily enzyme YgiQ (UPF0313 family)
MRIALTMPYKWTDTTAAFAMPYGLAVIAGLLKKRFPGDELFYSDDEEEILAADRVYCSGLTNAWDLVNDLGRKCLVGYPGRYVVGGQHVTALPRTLKYGEAFRGPLEDLNNLGGSPLPDWGVLKSGKTFGGESFSYTVMTSRGCPFHCGFCSSSSFWKGYFDLPVPRVMAELRQLAELGASNVNIFDDLFTVNRGRLKEISNAIVAEGLNRITYQCLTRADSVDAETVAALRKMNVQALAFGAESGSDAILKAMNKRATVAQNQRCIDILNAAGYKPVTSVVIGYPGETRETLDETRRFIERNRGKCAGITVYPVQPLPGTRLWNLFCEKYRPDLDTFDWGILTINDNGADWTTYPLMSDGCTVDDLREMCEWNISANDLSTDSGDCSAEVRVYNGGGVAAGPSRGAPSWPARGKTRGLRFFHHGFQQGRVAVIHAVVPVYPGPEIVGRVAFDFFHDVSQGRRRVDSPVCFQFLHVPPVRAPQVLLVGGAVGGGVYRPAAFGGGPLSRGRKAEGLPGFSFPGDNIKTMGGVFRFAYPV